MSGTEVQWWKIQEKEGGSNGLGKNTKGSY